MNSKKFILLILTSLALFSGCASKKKSNSNLAYNYYHQALVAVEKNPREALNLINKSLDNYVIPRAKVFKATLLFQIEEYQESLNLFEIIINDKNTPEALRADALNNYACALQASDKLDQAETVWKNLTTNKHYISPELASLNLGLLNLKKNNLKDSINFFNKAIKISPDYIDAYYWLTIVLIKLKEWKPANKIVKELLSLAPEHDKAKDLLNEINKNLK